MIIGNITYCQTNLIDTLKVYNVYCSIIEGNSVFGWGGNWTSFYPPDSCTSPKDKYFDNFKEVNKIMNSGKFYWIKLYNINDDLIFEGLKYSDCQIGPFVCYYLNGNIKLTGQYSGYKITKMGKYKMKTCSGSPIGLWTYYDVDGNIIKTEDNGD